MTVQGQVFVKNNTDIPMADKDCELFMYSVMTNKKLTLTRVSASLESVTVSRDVGKGIRTGSYQSRV